MVSVFSHYCSPRQIGLFALEAFALAAAISIALLLSGAPVLVATVGAPLSVLLGLFYLVDLYDLSRAATEARSGPRLLVALGASAGACGAMALLLRLSFPPGALLASFGGACGAALLVRTAWAAAQPGRLVRLLVFGAGARARELARSITSGAGSEYEIAGFIGENDAQVLSGDKDLLSLARRVGASIVVVAPDDRRGSPVEQLLRCRASGVQVLEMSTFSERALRRLPLAVLRPSELAFQDGFAQSVLADSLLRIGDVAMSLIILILSAPALALVSILIKLDSPGPLLYRQDRVGQGGRTFEIIKLRTMCCDAEAGTGPVWAGERDARMTRLGALLRKCRVDEIPQVWCVLRGDMSFVGPRPERPFFVDQLARQIPFYRLREAVKPGITGWAQIRYPYGASIEDARAKLEFDLYYMKHRSLFLNLLVIFHTGKTVLFGKGAR